MTTETNAQPDLYDRIVSVLQTDLEEKSVIIKWLAWRLKLIYEIGEKFWWDNCFTFAASLAYTTLLALAPLAAVSLSILTTFDFSKTTVLNFVFQRLLPNQDLAAIIETNIESFSANAASVSIFGVVALVLFSVWVMSTIESAFNMIWRVDQPRPIINQFMAYWSSLTFAPILIAVSIILTARIQGLVLSEDWAEYTYIQSFTIKVIPYILTMIAFFLVYKLIPYTNVHFVPALWGAVIAGAMFEIAKLFFDYYILNWASYTVIYGALAVIPIFLFWLYVTWLIVLLGSIIAYAIQYPKEIKSIKHEGFDRTRYLNYYTLRLLVEAAASFEADKGPVKPRDAQKKLEITGEFYIDILMKLKKLDLVEMVDGAGETFLLKRPPENIYIADLLSKLSGEVFNVSPEPVDAHSKALQEFFATVRSSIDEGIEKMNLLELTRRLQVEQTENGEGDEGKPDQHTQGANLVELVKGKSETA